MGAQGGESTGEAVEDVIITTLCFGGRGLDMGWGWGWRGVVFLEAFLSGAVLLL